MGLNVEFTIIDSAVNYNGMKTKKKKILVTRHNAGFFSCCTIRLMDIIHYFNKNKGLPDEVDSFQQFVHYKSYPGQDLTNFYFDQQKESFEYAKEVPLLDCMAIQFDSYRNLDFLTLNMFVDKYFTPSQHVSNIVEFYIEKYQLDLSNTCAVFYRGNDKNKEMSVAPYELFIKKAKEVQKKNPGIKFLVQPDETDFLIAFLEAFPDAVYFTETPHIQNKESAVFYEHPIDQRAEYGAKFLAAVLVISGCKHVITHSGNCGLWAALYRGNSDNLHQIFNGQWI